MAIKRESEAARFGRPAHQSQLALGWSPSMTSDLHLGQVPSTSRSLVLVVLRFLILAVLRRANCPRRSRCDRARAAAGPTEGWLI